MLARTALLLTLLFTGCKRGVPTPPPDSSSKLTVTLQDATVAEVVKMLAHVTKQPIVVEPDAQVVSNCARMSLIATEPVPPSQLRNMVADALQSTSVNLVESSGGWILKRVPGVPLPLDCLNLERPPTPPAPAASMDSAPLDPDTENKLRAGIRKVSETRFELNAQAQKLVAEHLDAIMKTVRIVPHLADNKVTGLKLFGVRRDGVLANLGIQNGDLLSKVGGHDMTNPEAALQGYSELSRKIKAKGLSKSETLTINVVRKGEPLTIEYVGVE